MESFKENIVKNSFFSLSKLIGNNLSFCQNNKFFCFQVAIMSSMVSPLITAPLVSYCKTKASLKEFMLACAGTALGITACTILTRNNKMGACMMGGLLGLSVGLPTALSSGIVKKAGILVGTSLYLLVGLGNILDNINPHDNTILFTSFMLAGLGALVGGTTLVKKIEDMI